VVAVKWLRHTFLQTREMIGVDVVWLSRMKGVLARLGALRFACKVLTEKEVGVLQQLPPERHPVYIAGR
jgi:phosphopantetheinyl transferase (holo-ACP synthase)